MQLDVGAHFDVLRPLIGREAEMAGIRERVREARLVTLTGPGGVGKTRLALELATNDGGTFVDLSPLRDAALIAPEVAAAIGADPDPGVAPETWIARATSSGPAILVLDNLEQIAAATEAVGAILVAAPNVRVLATSRVPLGLPGELQMPISPLAAPVGDTLEDVRSSPAGEMLLSSMRAKGQDDRLDASSAASFAALCRRLDGLPLAIELATARLGLFSADAILRRLATGPRVLARSAGGRHGSLEAVLDWSLELLGDSPGRAFRVLSVCRGGFELPLAEALLPWSDALEALEELVRQGLLNVEQRPDGEPRFTMLETIRSAAEARLEGAEAAVARRALAHHMARIVAEHGTQLLVPGTGTPAALEADRDNIRAALDWAVVEDPDLGLEIASRCRDHWVSRGALAEGIGRLTELIEAAPTAAPARARALAILGHLRIETEGLSAAAETVRAALRTALELGDLIGEARARSLLVVGRVGSPSEYGVHLDRVEEIAATLHEPVLALRAALDRASAALWGGDDEAAIEAWHAAAARATSLGHPEIAALALGNLSEAYLDAARPREALAAAIEADRARQQAGPYPIGQAWILGQIATAQARLGDQDSARATLRRAIDVAHDYPAPVPIGNALQAALAVFIGLGDPTLGCRALGASRKLRADTGEPETLGEVRSIEIDLARARRQLDPVKVEIAIRSGYEAGAAAVLAEVELALERHVDGGRPAERIGLRHGNLTAREVEVLGLLAEGRSDREIAESLFISPKTASVHVSNVKSKLGAETRLEAALRAREMGLGG